MSDAGVLQLVGLQFVQQSDPAALVAADVEHDAAALAATVAERGVQLRPAVAAQRPEHVAGQAFRVHPHEHVLPSPMSPKTNATCSRSS